MYKRKSLKLISFLLTLCFLLTAFSGSAIQAQAEELGIDAGYMQIRTNSAVSSMPFVFRHLYDSETFTSMKNYVNSAVSLVNQIYSFNFPATTLSSTDYPISVDNYSGLNDCFTDTEMPCLPSLGCGSYVEHHKDIANISDNLYAWRTRNYGTNNENVGQIVVLWTNYEPGVYCYYHIDGITNSYVHEYPSSLACVFDNRPVIHIMNIATTNSSHYASHMGILLAHELTHCIGHDDQYDSEEGAIHAHDDTMNCIMDYFVDEAVDEDGNIIYPAVEFRNRIVANYNVAFCSTCDASLRNLIDDWISAYSDYVG